MKPALNPGFIDFAGLGFSHVLPDGFDHVLFVMAVFFMSSGIRTIILQCTVFTIAHSLTLFLAFIGSISVNPAVSEPVIALSVVFAALQNIVSQEVRMSRWLTVFGFGLIHGMGFATSLNELNMAGSEKFLGMLGFNLGVEIAQLFIVLSLYYGLVKYIRNYSWYRTRLVWPVSALIACAGMYQLTERLTG